MSLHAYRPPLRAVKTGQPRWSIIFCKVKHLFSFLKMLFQIIFYFFQALQRTLMTAEGFLKNSEKFCRFDYLC